MDTEPERRALPTSFQNAVCRPESAKCMEALKYEIQSLNNMQTLGLVEKPPDRKVIKTEWVFDFLDLCINQSPKFGNPRNMCYLNVRYLNGTQEFGLVYQSGGAKKIEAFSDADWEFERPSKKSVNGNALMCAGSFNNWRSKQ